MYTATEDHISTVSTFLYNYGKTFNTNSAVKRHVRTHTDTNSLYSPVDTVQTVL